MGRGDKRSAKGKRFKGSFGNSRPQRKKKVAGGAAKSTATKKPKVEKTEKVEKPTVKKAPAKKAAKKKEGE